MPALPTATLLGWVLPPQARKLRWTASKAELTSNDVGKPDGVELSADEILVVPVAPGDRVEVSGPQAAVGLAAGTEEIPDVITWFGPTPSDTRDRRELWVPTWTSARFVAVRGREHGARLTLRIASRQPTAMAWKRLVEHVSVALERDAPLPGDGPSEAAPLLRWLGAARSALAASEHPASVRRWLFGRFVEESYRVRPLVMPFFVSRPVTVAGGRLDPTIPPYEEASAFQVIRPGERATVLVRGGDVLRLGVRRPMASGARFSVRVGAVLLRTLDWQPSASTAHDGPWAQPEWLRIPLPVSEAREAKVVVDVERGSLALDAVAYSEKAPLFRWPGTRRFPVGLPPFTQEGGRCQERGQVRRGELVLCLAEAARGALTVADAERLTGLAIEKARSLPGAVAGPLVRFALEHLVALGRQPAPAASSAAPVFSGAHPDDSLAAASYAAQRAPEQDGVRPTVAASAESYAQTHAEADDAARRARATWLEEGPMQELPLLHGTAIEGTPTMPQADVRPGICQTRGARTGLRWTVLGQDEGRVDVAPTEGTHARVILRPEPAAVAPDFAISVDGMSIPIHSGAGLGSVVALGKGPHWLRRPAHAPVVLARIPREDELPCSELRDWQVWAAGPEIDFLLAPDGTPTVGRLLFERAPDKTNATSAARWSAGAVLYEAWIRWPATGAAEFPVAPGVGTLHVKVDDGVRVRAAARRRRGAAMPLPLPATLREPQPAASPAVETRLSQVRAATQRLHAGPPLAERLRYLHERALALRELGADRLAETDVATGNEAVGMDTYSPAQLGSSESLILPAGSPSVLPIGVLSRIPALPLSSNRARTARAKAAFRRRDFKAASELLGHALGSDQLLLGVAAELAGEPVQAATAFERIGFDSPSGAALAHAAGLLADGAIARGQQSLIVRAFALATQAEQLGEDAGAAFGRLAPAVRWLDPGRVDRASGFVQLVTTRVAADQEPLFVRVRRARTDAPDHAALLGQADRASIRLSEKQPTRVVLRQLCEALESPLQAGSQGPFAAVPSPVGAESAGLVALASGQHSAATHDAHSAPCRLDLLLDGLPVPRATSVPKQVEVSVINVPEGQHRLDIVAPKDRDVIGWVEAKSDRDGVLAPIVQMSSQWLAIDQADPLELMVVGPTVVRLRARAASPRPTTLQVRIEPLSVATGQEPVTREWPLDPRMDGSSRRLSAGSAVTATIGVESETRLVVVEEGPHRVVVSPGANVAYVRVEVATAAGMPRARREALLSATPSKSDGLSAAWSSSPPVASDPSTLPFTLSVRETYVPGDIELLNENQLSSFGHYTFVPYFQTQVYFLRELYEGRAWLALSPFVRLRAAPTSYGSALRLDVVSRAPQPSLSTNVQLTAQPIDTGETALGATASATVTEYLYPARDLQIAPFSTFYAVRVDPAGRTTAGADRDIYTNYGSTHPQWASLGLAVGLRPLTDTQIKFTGFGRSTPDFAGADRIDGRVDLDTVPGEGMWPWMGVSWQSSLRPVTAERPQMFVRQTLSARVMLWRWLAVGQRVALTANATYLFDTPRLPASQPGLSAVVTLACDYSGGRGVRDYPLDQTLFRERLEEGSGRVRRRVAGEDPQWLEEP